MKRILLAYDGTDPARRALETAADLAKKYEASVTVVSVVPVHPGRAPIDPWDDVEVHDAQLREADLALRALGIEAKLLEPAGDPASSIERVAAKGEFDTIVIGARGLSTIGRMLQGSVSAHVATHAQTDVVIVR
jgi:nucleotide-binding universal stress UspA family protein